MNERLLLYDLQSQLQSFLAVAPQLHVSHVQTSQLQFAFPHFLVIPFFVFMMFNLEYKATLQQRLLRYTTFGNVYIIPGDQILSSGRRIDAPISLK